jgi:hypothetical protein
MNPNKLKYNSVNDIAKREWNREDLIKLLELHNYVYERAFEDTDDPDVDVITLGYIDLENDPYYAEGAVGNISLKGSPDTVVVEIRPREGWTQPHVHVYNKTWGTAVRFDEPTYFCHGFYQGTFTSKQAKQFDNFMRSKTESGITIWQLCRDIFNLEFSMEGHKLKANEQPDYAKLDPKIKR